MVNFKNEELILVAFEQGLIVTLFIGDLVFKTPQKGRGLIAVIAEKIKTKRHVILVSLVFIFFLVKERLQEKDSKILEDKRGAKKILRR